MVSIRNLLCPLIVWAVIAKAGWAADSSPESLWKAGVAKASITPTQRLPMAGYAARTAPAEGPETDLFAKALAIEDTDGNRVVLMTLDLIGVRAGLRETVAQESLKRFGLAPERLVMNASHTHCGPSYEKPESSEYLMQLQTTLVEVIGKAIADLQPAHLSYCHARCNFAMNRRTLDGSTYRNHPNPDGPVDASVPVLAVESTDGTLRVVLFGYACHNTTLSFLKWCGDYAGYAQAALEADHPGVTALFMMGCGGDQNPYPRGQVQYAQQHGKTLATSVEAALEIGQTKKFHRHRLAGKLRCQLETVSLEYSDAARKPLDYPVQVLRLGDSLLMVVLASEVTIDYSLRLKRELTRDGGPTIWVAAYSNLYDGYIPSQRVLAEGGYEAESRPWSPTLEAKIVGKVHELVNQ